MAQVTIDDSGPQVLATSEGGDVGRATRVAFTVVGAGTIWVDKDDSVSEETGMPFTEGVYGSDEFLRAGETLYAVASSGEEVDVRVLKQGAR